MTNSDKLKRKIQNNEVDFKRLAKLLKISESELMSKIEGDAEFLASELWLLGKALSLSSSELQDIFLSIK